MRSVFPCVVLALVLAGCVTQESLRKYAENSVPPTPAMKAAIVDKARDTLYDPYSVRDAEISSVMNTGGLAKTDVVCVRANAKNRMGGYTGRSMFGVFFKDGVMIGGSENVMMCFADNLRWTKFVELENLKNL